MADEIDLADSFKEDVYTIMVKIEQLSLQGATVPPTAPAGGGPKARIDSASCGGKVKLPKLMIQPFKGELTACTIFWDSYKAAIDDNPSVSDIDKYNYLRSLLQGFALDTVAGLTLTHHCQLLRSHLCSEKAFRKQAANRGEAHGHPLEQ